MVSVVESPIGYSPLPPYWQAYRLASNIMDQYACILLRNSPYSISTADLTVLAVFRSRKRKYSISICSQTKVGWWRRISVNKKPTIWLRQAKLIENDTDRPIIRFEDVFRTALDFNKFMENAAILSQTAFELLSFWRRIGQRRSTDYAILHIIQRKYCSVSFGKR